MVHDVLLLTLVNAFTYPLCPPMVLLVFFYCVVCYLIIHQ